MQNFVGKTKCIVGYMKVADDPATLPLHVVVINGGCSSPSDVSSELPNSSIINQSIFIHEIVSFSHGLPRNRVQN